MSERLNLKPRDRDHEQVVVGWDGPMQTFFAQVVNKRKEVVFWVGQEAEQIKYAAVIVGFIAAYATVTPELCKQLEEAQRNDTRPVHPFARLFTHSDHA